LDTSRINGRLLRQMMVAGAERLAAQKDYVDSLNVFPVPDGDTGTNMSLTALAAAREVEKLDTDTATVADVAKAASNGALRGARGNSGVILSQLFRGFAKGLDGCADAGVDELARALAKATETAYKAVMKPKEGTILTVAREIGEKALEVSFETEDLTKAVEAVLAHGYDTLNKTPEMLPVLKQAGVVDAGGQGLLTLLEGAVAAADESYVPRVAVDAAPTKLDADFSVLNTFSHEDITFGYCTEFFVIMEAANDEAEEELKAYLSDIGDSIVVVTDDNFIKIHVHTDNPGMALEKALTFGALDGLKIENMRLQHAEATAKAQAAPAAPVYHADENSSFTPIEKTTGFVVVSVGDGFKAVFEGLGADVVIEGGQTMNPSTEDILAAVAKVPAENVIILPNNKNIVLAAQQATYLSEKKIFVVPTKSIPQGISALLAFMPMAGAEENAAAMEEAAGLVRTGQITYAVRDTVIDDKEIKEGDFLCMVDGRIELVCQSLQTGAKALLERMMANGGEVATIFYGAEVDEADAQALGDEVGAKFPDCEMDVQCGAQPLYFYIFSVE